MQVAAPHQYTLRFGVDVLNVDRLAGPLDGEALDCLLAVGEHQRASTGTALAGVCTSAALVAAESVLRGVPMTPWIGNCTPDYEYDSTRLW